MPDRAFNHPYARLAGPESQATRPKYLPSTQLAPGDCKQPVPGSQQNHQQKSRTQKSFSWKSSSRVWVDFESFSYEKSWITLESWIFAFQSHCAFHVSNFCTKFQPATWNSSPGLMPSAFLQRNKGLTSERIPTESRGWLHDSIPPKVALTI